MNNLNDDILRSIILFLKPYHLYSIQKINKYFYNILIDNKFCEIYRESYIKNQQNKMMINFNYQPVFWKSSIITDTFYKLYRQKYITKTRRKEYNLLSLNNDNFIILLEKLKHQTIPIRLNILTINNIIYRFLLMRYMHSYEPYNHDFLIKSNNDYIFWGHVLSFTGIDNSKKDEKLLAIKISINNSIMYKWNQSIMALVDYSPIFKPYISEKIFFKKIFLYL